MIRTSFNKLREVKDSLPHGSMDIIANEVGSTADEIRGFFNGSAQNNGYHLEPGPDGGIVTLDNTRFLEVALRLAWEAKNTI